MKSTIFAILAILALTNVAKPALAADPISVQCEKGAVVTVTAVYDSKTGQLLANIDPKVVGVRCDDRNNTLIYVMDDFGGSPTFGSLADVSAFLKDIRRRGDVLSKGMDTTS